MCNVSVILPVYNVAPYLAECLESLMAQTFQDFEVIAVNDGSTDDSLAILEAYREKLPQLCIISQPNQGLSAARNTGLKQATGTYLYFLDSDDYIHNETLATCFTLAEKEQLDVVKFDAEPFTSRGVTAVNPYDSRAVLVENRVYSQQEWLATQRRHYNSPVWLYFVRADVLFMNGLQFVEGILHEDELFTPQLFTRAQRFMYVAQPFFKRRYRDGSIMQNNIYSSKTSYDSKRQVINRLDQERAVSKAAKQFLRSRRNALYMDSCSYDEVLRSKTPLNKWISTYLEARVTIRKARKKKGRR